MTKSPEFPEKLTGLRPGGFVYPGDRIRTDLGGVSYAAEVSEDHLTQPPAGEPPEVRAGFRDGEWLYVNVSVTAMHSGQALQTFASGLPANLVRGEQTVAEANASIDAAADRCLAQAIEKVADRSNAPREISGLDSIDRRRGADSVAHPSGRSV